MIPIGSRIFAAFVGIFLSKIDVIQVISIQKTYVTTKKRLFSRYFHDFNNKNLVKIPTK